jgi:hypothetical protein
MDNKHSNKEGSASKTIKKPVKVPEIDLDYIENILQKIFSYRNSEELSSRVRFRIQDLVDEYNKDWKLIIFGERQLTDSDGF